MTESLVVTLPEEASRQLRNQVTAIIGEAVSHAEKHSNTGEWLRGYAGLAAYIGCSAQSAKLLVNQGLEAHSIQALPKMLFFSRTQVDNFILHDGEL